VQALFYLEPITKYRYGLTFTEIKDFMYSLTDNYDPELYNMHFKKRALHKILPLTILQQR